MYYKAIIIKLFETIVVPEAMKNNINKIIASNKTKNLKKTILNKDIT